MQQHAQPTELQRDALPPSKLLKAINLTAVLLPFIGLILAFILLWGVAFNWIYLALLAGMYLVTAIGITVGYHRYFTHRSFRTSPTVASVLAILGSMAAEGPVIQWVAVHRKHHQHSDDDHDPHSPHTHGGGVMNVLRGIWHAHVGWLFRENPRGLARLVGDLRKEPHICMISRLFPLWVLIGLLIPTVLGGLLTLSWTGAALGFLWGGLVRIFLVHHVTWSINSVCHIWGSQPYDCGDESRNNVIFGVLALGEGWHNNHHAFPTSARHGLRWWQLDLSYLTILAMKAVGLAHDVRQPVTREASAKEKTDPARVP